MSLLDKRIRIAFVSQPEYFRFTYENDLDEFAQVKEFKLTFSLSPEQYADLLAYDADINFFFRGEFVPDEVLRQLHGKKVNLSSEPFPRQIDGRLEYTGDSLNRYIAFRDIRNKPYDYVFHYDAASLGLMKKDGLSLSGEFVFPVATDVYRPLNTNKEWDIFFIGRSTQHREEFFGLLKHYYNFLHVAHGVWGEGLVKYLNAARISLNVHAENEISWEPRLQMMLACGAFVISEKITPNSYLRPGVDYVAVANRQEMFDAVTYYLAHEDERNVIAKTGYNRILEKFSSKKIFFELINGLEQGIYPQFKAQRGYKLFDDYIMLNQIMVRFYAKFGGKR
jgi:hypothetical protein